MSFKPNLPPVYSKLWREAYRYDSNDTPRLSSYQPPGGTPVPFIMDNIRLSGGQSLDTAEYPFFGLWSSTPLNEKPHAITIDGFIRGETYIKNRNDMVEALRLTTDDTDHGFLDLPLWGRFPVVVVDYTVEEKGKENGQCAVSLTFTRAGVTAEERRKFKGSGFDEKGKTAAAVEDLEEAAIANFEQSLEGNVDVNSLAQGFLLLKDALIGAVGRIQGGISTLNSMTNRVAGIANLIAQGVRSPRELAEALIGAAGSIVSGAIEIRNSFENTINYFAGRGNYTALLLQFLSADRFAANMETSTVKQDITKRSVENLYRTTALCASAQIMVKAEMTYQRAMNFWALYEKLEASVNQNDPEVYRAVRDLRLSVAAELSTRNLDTELSRNISLPVPLLYLSKILGCDDEKLRMLNEIPDSFIIRGNVVYV